jgi:predicted O-methyltransferase YrrM
VYNAAVSSPALRFARHVAREYAFQLRRLLGVETPDRPMMRFREIELIETLLTNLRPARTLEWGMGASTLYFPRALPADARWVSVEHNPEWYDLVQGRLERESTTLLLAPPNDPDWDGHGDGTAETFADYVAAPEAHGPFDFILVDGRARAACLARAPALLASDGVVMLHDANRRYLDQALGDYPHQFFFRDYRPDSGGIWVASHRADLGALVHADDEAPLWSLTRRLGPLLRA